MDFAGASSTDFNFPPNTGLAATTAKLIFGSLRSSPNRALPSTFDGMSKRAMGLPTIV
jgi:hypothetical protein